MLSSSKITFPQLIVMSKQIIKVTGFCTELLTFYRKGVLDTFRDIVISVVDQKGMSMNTLFTIVRQKSTYKIFVDVSYCAI